MTRGARKEGLSRRHRFVGRGGFSPALRSSRKLRGTTMLLHLAGGTTGYSRLGVSIRKRQAPRAVDRNRLKRMAREAFRRHVAHDLGLDFVFTAREKFVQAGEKAWHDDFIALLDRAAAG